MQNRFTVKDFFYMLIGGVICLLIWLNMTAINQQNETLAGARRDLGNQQTTLSALNETIRGQQQALSSLSTAVENFRGSGGIDLEALAALTQRMGGTSGAGVGAGTVDPSDPLSDASRFQSGYNPLNRHAINTSSQNNLGLPQQWQTAPDQELPGDFAVGDALIEVWNTDAQKLTPIVATDAYARRVHWQTHEYLINFDLDAPFHYVPGIARAWEVSDDGMAVTFHLFEHARWSDGRPITAADVIFTWDVATNTQMDTAHYRSYTDRIAHYEALDSHTVRFRMKEKYFDAVGICGNLLIIIPRHVYGDYDPETFNNGIHDLCVGSGRYILESWVRGQQIVLVRNENYWGPKPALGRYVIRVITSDLPKLQEFRSGAVDLIPPTAEQYVENVDAQWFAQSGAQAILYYSPRGGYNYIGYNLRRPHFADKRTRQALTMLIDRQALIDTVVEGLGIPISGPFFFNSDQYNSSIDPLPYDPQRARELLREVGWEDTDNDGILDMDLSGDGRRQPFEITYLLPSGGALGDRIQRFVQNAFRQAGIRLNLEQLEWSVFLERLHERDYDMVTLSWTGSPEGDPTQIWHSSSEPNRGSNHVGFINPRADELIESARAEIDREKRMKLWHELHALIHEEQPYTFLYARPYQFFLHKRFKGVHIRDYRLYPDEWYVPAMDQVR